MTLCDAIDVTWWIDVGVANTEEYNYKQCIVYKVITTKFALLNFECVLWKFCETLNVQIVFNIQCIVT